MTLLPVAPLAMLVRRAALVECGWLERPLLSDRAGRRLMSGGDVEIAQRIRGAGYPLWFAPDAVLRHRIASDRASWHYLLRVNYELGASEALVNAGDQTIGGHGAALHSAGQ